MTIININEWLEVINNMRLSIDAWLERKDPRIRLIDAETGEVIFRWGPQQVRELIDTGDLCVSDIDQDCLPCREVIELIEELSSGQRVPLRERMLKKSYHV